MDTFGISASVAAVVRGTGGGGILDTFGNSVGVGAIGK